MGLSRATRIRHELTHIVYRAVCLQVVLLRGSIASYWL